MRPNQLGKCWRRRAFLLKSPMARHGPESGQGPADQDEKESDETPIKESQAGVSAQLAQQQRPDDPADPTGIGLMRLGEAFGPPTGEVGIGAKQDQPGDRGHGDVDARYARLD